MRFIPFAISNKKQQNTHYSYEHSLKKKEIANTSLLSNITHRNKQGASTYITKNYRLAKTDNNPLHIKTIKGRTSQYALYLFYNWKIQ
jgi:hypothetical protein